MQLHSRGCCWAYITYELYILRMNTLCLNWIEGFFIVYKGQWHWEIELSCFSSRWFRVWIWSVVERPERKPAWSLSCFPSSWSLIRLVKILVNRLYRCDRRLIGLFGLFISCLQTIFDKLQWNDKQIGLQIGNEYLNNLRFAHDIVLTPPKNFKLWLTNCTQRATE